MPREGPSLLISGARVSGQGNFNESLDFVDFSDLGRRLRLLKMLREKVCTNLLQITEFPTILNLCLTGLIFPWIIRE